MNSLLKFLFFIIMILILSSFLPNIFNQTPSVSKNINHQNEIFLNLLPTEGELSLIQSKEKGKIEIVPTERLSAKSKTEDLNIPNELNLISDLDIDIHIFDNNRKYLKSLGLNKTLPQSDFFLEDNLYYIQFIDAQDRSKTIWMSLNSQG